MTNHNHSTCTENLCDWCEFNGAHVHGTEIVKTKEGRVWLCDECADIAREEV